MSDGPFKPDEAHEVYLKTAKRLGWPIRQGLDVPYDQLSDDAKALDIALVEHFNSSYHELHPPVSEGMRFTAEDFDGLDVCCGDYQCGLKAKAQSAELAQSKLQRILAQGVRVFKINKSDLWSEEDSDLRQTYAISHSGIVINIEELK